MPIPDAADVAVVVVNYNAGDHLLRCLESVRSGAGSASVDCVVVDNASTDGSAARAEAEHPWIRLVENRSNRGFARAANEGIRATTAPYVLLMNPDAEIRAGTLESFAKVAADRPRAGAIGALVRNPDGSLQPSARKVPSLVEGLGHSLLHPFAPDNRWSRAYTMADWDRASEREVEWVSGSCVLLRRRALREVGLFDEGYFMYVEDVDLCTRLRLAGWQVLFSPELEVSHVIGVSSGAGRRMAVRMAFEHSRSISRYFGKFHGRGPSGLLRPAVWAALQARALLVSARRRTASPRP